MRVLTGLSSVADVVGLYASRGDRRYGEGVTQTEHAVQCAMLAQANGAADALVVAALLHDIGHLLVDPIDFAVDDRHEEAGADALAALFGEAVSRPVALHVAAKRYLCRIEPSYASALSRASRASLAVQGGAYGSSEAEAFEALPHWREAVALRRFDDRGKCDTSAPRAFDDFVPLMHRLTRSAA